MDDISYTIYKLSFPGGEFYIGKTKRDLKERWNYGFGYTSKKTKCVIDKYGRTNPGIQMEPIYENLSKEDACYMENKLILENNWPNNPMLLNVRTGGDYGYVLGKEVTDNLSKKIKQRMVEHPEYLEQHSKCMKQLHEEHPEIWEDQKKPVKQYTYEGTYIQTFESITEAALQTGTNLQSLSNCLNGHNDTAGGFHWFYDDRKEHPIMYCYSNEIPVVQKDKNTGKIIKKYKSIREASRATGIGITAISRVIRKIPKYKSAGGFLWELDDGY